MNRITLNGMDSTLIKGLLISSLPPITKPAQRTNIEEIDGRDGDIVTKLGYSAYDKKMTIGLFGDFNIDDIIQYFDSEGTVIFSNEPDKLYRYQILNQIDFDRLLRFRTATVTFHVQPFKFSSVDDRVVVSTNLFDGFDYVETQHGLTIALKDGVITLTGTATGAPEFMIPIKKIHLVDGAQYTMRFGVVSGESSAVEVCIYEDDDPHYPVTSYMMGGQRFTMDSSRGKVFTQDEDTDYTIFCLDVAPGNVGTTFNMIIIPEVFSEYVTNVELVNRGNVYSRPKLTFFGTGTVTALGLSFSVGGRITLDGESLNAYDSTGLRNRDVTGDMRNVRLPIGPNSIVLGGTGKCTKVIVEDYTRWI